jgi:hypothetical protein
MNVRLSFDIGARILKAILAGLLVVSAGIGTYIGATDSYLWAAAPSHAYGLVAFVVIDLVAAGALYALPRASRVLALLLPLVQFAAMAGDMYMGLGSPGSVVQSGFRFYLLSNSAFMALFVLQAVLIGLASGYLVQRPLGSLGERRASEVDQGIGGTTSSRSRGQ